DGMGAWAKGEMDGLARFGPSILVRRRDVAIHIPKQRPLWNSTVCQLPIGPRVRYDKAMPTASSYLPAGFHTLTAHLTVNGAAKYIEFLKQAFDAVELTRSPSADGRLLNASVRIGDSVMM